MSQATSTGNGQLASQREHGPPARDFAVGGLLRNCCSRAGGPCSFRSDESLFGGPSAAGRIPPDKNAHQRFRCDEAAQGKGIRYVAFSSEFSLADANRDLRVCIRLFLFRQFSLRQRPTARRAHSACIYASAEEQPECCPTRPATTGWATTAGAASPAAAIRASASSSCHVARSLSTDACRQAAPGPGTWLLAG